MQWCACAWWVRRMGGRCLATGGGASSEQKTLTFGGTLSSDWSSARPAAPGRGDAKRNCCVCPRAACTTGFSRHRPATDASKGYQVRNGRCRQNFVHCRDFLTASSFRLRYFSMACRQDDSRCDRACHLALFQGFPNHLTESSCFFMFQVP